MDKRSSTFVGAALVLLGFLSLALSAVTHLLGLDLFGFVWRFWPSTIVGLGAFLALAPFLWRRHRGLAALLIPGLLLLITGAILFLASVLNVWSIWAWLWPMEILALGMGFLAAAVLGRLPGLVVPAVILGLNGLVFQFCAITGLWEAWSVLWVVEPLAVGLALVALGLWINKRAVVTVGLGLCGLAMAGLALMLTILGGWWPVRLVTSGLIILAGLAVLLWGLVRPRLRIRSALE